MPFSVQDFHDLLRLLEERPEWRTELRRVVLADDLLRLPEDLARARQETDERFRELGEQIAALAARIEALTARVEALTAQVATLAGHVGTLRGESLEQRYRTRAFAYFGRILRSAHVLANDELAALLESAIQAGVLTDRDAHEVALADLVVRGRRQQDGALVYLVVEVSVGAGLDDVQRAVERADLLARTGVAALPAVAGEWVTPDGNDAARAHHVWQITDGRIVAPEPLQA